MFNTVFCIVRIASWNLFQSVQRPCQRCWKTSSWSLITAGYTMSQVWIKFMKKLIYSFYLFFFEDAEEYECAERLERYFGEVKDQLGLTHCLLDGAEWKFCFATFFDGQPLPCGSFNYVSSYRCNENPRNCGGSTIYHQQMLTTVICKNLRRRVRSCFVSSWKFWYGFRIYMSSPVFLGCKNFDVISELCESSILLPQWTLWLAPPPTSPSSSSLQPLSLGYSSRLGSDQALHCIFAEG